MADRKVVNYSRVKDCINAEKHKVSRENLNGIKSEKEKYFFRAWCLRQCEWCDAEFGVKECYYSTDDNID